MTRRDRIKAAAAEAAHDLGNAPATISKAGKDPANFICLNSKATAKDTLLEEPVRVALLGKKAKDIFEKVLSLCSVKGALDGVFALRWNLRK